jgi:hypothetical protein
MKMFSRVSCSTTRVKVRVVAHVRSGVGRSAASPLIPATIAWSFSMAASTIALFSPASFACSAFMRS